MRKWVWLVVVLVCQLLPVTAQDIDSNPLVQKRSVSGIADQITDPAERTAFLQLFLHAPAERLLASAQTFLNRFPQSSFLAQAYEVACRASFDLQNYEAGLDYARRSLSLLPENPLLLVAVADVEAHRHLNHAAITDAEEALRDLDNFAGPSSVREEDWPDVKRGLKASANFSTGRALLQQALELPAGNNRTQLLRSSQASLTQAQHLNPTDTEITYTLGLVQLTSGSPESAAGNFLVVYRNGGETASRALDSLRAIYKLVSSGTDLTFETFVQQTENRKAISLQNPTDDSGGHIAAQTASTYAGSESCRGCHSAIYTQWSNTGMAKMFRAYAPENVIGDFKDNNQFYLGDDAGYRDGKGEITRAAKRTLFARMVIRDNRHYFDMLHSDGKCHAYPVDYIIGSKFEQAYATKLPNGEIHVFPIQYNVLLKQWVNFWKVIDGPESERADPRTWERLDTSTSYQAICAICHTSQLKNVKGPGFDVKNLEFQEPGINCEMCHGPSAEHVLETTANEYPPKSPQTPPINFHAIDKRQSVAVCGQCHMQSAIRRPGASGELNYSSGGSFFSDMLRQPFGEFSRKGFYKDGRFRQTTFMVEALERSKCFKKAAVSCGTCHDPHSHDAASNLTSLKLRDQSDRMCTGCHTQFQDRVRASQHSHHSVGSEGSRCVSCHMPRIMDALLFRARYHQIDDIPNAGMTKRFGQEESPNACLLCHQGENADWVQKQVSGWKTTVVTQQ